jgi:hypothetical protein
MSYMISWAGDQNPEPSTLGVYPTRELAFRALKSHADSILARLGDQYKIYRITDAPDEGRGAESFIITDGPNTPALYIIGPVGDDDGGEPIPADLRGEVVMA